MGASQLHSNGPLHSSMVNGTILAIPTYGGGERKVCFYFFCTGI